MIAGCGQYSGEQTGCIGKVPWFSGGKWISVHSILISRMSILTMSCNYYITGSELPEYLTQKIHDILSYSTTLSGFHYKIIS